MAIFKPMLADPVDFSILKYPIIASPKLDGVRATMIGGKLITRNLKRIPNKYVDAIFTHPLALDGELIVGDPRDKDCFRNTQSVTSSHEGDISDLRLHVFDLVESGEFQERFEIAADAIRGNKHIISVPHAIVRNEADLLMLEKATVDEGFEGLMIRDPKGKYKFGRSTAREQGLLKLKRKTISEARVVGFEEQMHNANEAKINALGYMERSSHQANQTPMGVLGALQVKDIKTGVAFNIGSGFTFADRQEIWNNRPKYLNKIASYEHSPTTKEAPRHPAFKGWRMEEDIDV